MWLQTRDFSDGQLGKFKSFQRQVYTTLQDIAETLKPGETETKTLALARLNKHFMSEMLVKWRSTTCGNFSNPYLRSR